MNTVASPIAVGKEVVCFCTKCKMDLGHTIVSMKGANPARVICRTCKSEHNYKMKKGVKEPGSVAAGKGTPRAPRVPKEKVDPAVPIELEWMKQMNGSTRPSREYAANVSFGSGDKVAHASFGEGIIQRVIFPNKVEVLFRGDIKVLIHAGKIA
jgi:hypothetical protein